MFFSDKVKFIYFHVCLIKCNFKFILDTNTKNYIIMILTTTNSIEGHKIEAYLGIVTGASSLLKTSFSFKTEKNLNMISDIINKAKEEAFQLLKINATKLNASAVVGISLDMETEGGTYVFVSVTGTAVKIK